jgi:hypothetical protein
MTAIPGQTTVYDFLDDDECAWVHLSLAWAVLTLDYSAPDTASLSKWNPTHTDVPSWLLTGRTYPDTTTCVPSTGAHGAGELTSYVAASRAKTYPSLESAPDLPANKAGCSTTSPALQMTLLAKADSFYSKTSRVFSPRTVGEISPSFSGRWPNSGFTTRLGECWIAVTSESHNDGAACSSLGGVVAANVAPRFFLNPKAAAGILRRATKRRRKIPMALRTALSEIAIGSKTSETEPSQATPVEATESRWSLRRLTPTECERLQGMPDGWTKRLERTGTDIQRRATP